MKINFKKVVLIFSLVAGLLISQYTQAQTGIITTIAGIGQSGYSGDGGPADSAKLHYPVAVVIDSSGNLYISDRLNSCIRKVDLTTRIISTIAGVGIDPNGMAIDAFGNIIFADATYNCIRKITVASGIVTTIAGNGIMGYSGDGGLADSAEFRRPTSVAIDTAGNIYIADFGNNVIRKIIVSTGIITTIIGNGFHAGTDSGGYSGDGGPANLAKLNHPLVVALDDSGNVYFSDCYNNVIRKVGSSSGTITTIAGNGYGAGTSNGGYSGDGGPAISAKLYEPLGIALDVSRNVYIADGLNHRIRKVNATTGIITTFAGNGQEGYGGDGGPADSAKLGVAHGAVVDSHGNVYVAVENYDCIRKISAIPLSINIGANQIACSGSNIALMPATIGGIPPYYYVWHSNSDTLNCYTCQNPSVNLSQNSSFSVTVTDAAQHTATASVAYEVGASNNMQFAISNTLISCASGRDTTTITVVGGTPPFAFKWGNSDSSSGYSPQQHYYTQAGQHTISVIDSNGCQSIVFDTVLNPNPVLITRVGFIQPGCPGLSNGEIIVSVSGSTPPYTLLWNDGSNSDTLFNAAAGAHTLLVSDAYFCSATFKDTLSPTLTSSDYYVYLEHTNINCNTGGTISSTVTGGTPPYNYAWSDGDSAAIIHPLNANNYVVTVTDSSGCTATGNALLSAACNSVIEGRVFIDTNNNCVFDAGEQGLNEIFVVIKSSNGNYYYGYTDHNGHYSIEITDIGTDTLGIISPFITCGDLAPCGNWDSAIYLPVLGDSSLNNDFAYTNVTGFDLELRAGCYSANPGFEKEYWIYSRNLAPGPLTGPITVAFKYDSNLVFLSSETPYTTYSPTADSITWTTNDFNNVNFNLIKKIRFNVPSTLSLDYQLQSKFWIYPYDGDCDTSNNHLYFSEIVTGSHDPNEKDVEPAGNITADDSILTYSIHFQNTGTDSTHFIIVTDTLSPNLDPATVRNLASSYTYSDFKVSGKGILTWVFNPYRLVDSTTNPSGSKGFITFSVQQRKNLPFGSAISNTASIYFDYNTPVVTNTVTDTIATPTFVFEVSNGPGISVKAFPNPFNDQTNIIVSGINQKFDFELFDLTGRLLRQMPLIQTNQFQLQRSDLSGGIYLYRISVTGK